MASAKIFRAVPPEFRQGRLRGATTPALVALALTAAVAAGLALPRATYTAAAVVGVDGGPASLRPALIQAAADAARSRQVAARAAAALPKTATARAETLAAAVRIDAGRVPGTLVVRADDADAERAATMASTLATALVAELEDRTQAARRDGDAADALRLTHLQEAAAEAHRKLRALGGDAADPVASRTAAATRAEALQARLAAIRSILAAGTPPLGAGRDVPPTIEALQAGYLDLSRQLAKARETMGERHTTVIGLQEAIHRSASELTAAWTRLAKMTEQDLADARRAAAARGGLDAGRAAALDGARAAARLADDAVARAAAPRDADEQPRWHLVARASAPALAEGLGLPSRLALAFAAGLLALLLGRRVFRTRAAGAEVAAASQTAPPTARAEPTFFDDAPSHEADAVAQDHEEADVGAAAEPPAHRAEPAIVSQRHQRVRAPAPASSRDELELDEMLEETVGILEDKRDLGLSIADPDPFAPDFVAADFVEDELVAALAQALPAIDAMAPRLGVPIVLVATNEAGVGTMDTVLALSATAAAVGRRVLVVEGPRARPTLAAAVDPDATPALVDVLGETRIALRAASGAGLVYLAPSFRDGARLAADIARAGTAAYADAVADEFDLVVVDGDRAADAAALAAQADAVLRVGRFASPRDTEHFLATLDAPASSFIGSVASAVAAYIPAPARPVAPHAPRMQRAHAPAHPLRRTPADARRRVGMR